MRDRITSAGEQTAISAGVKNLISLEASVQTGGKCACKDTGCDVDPEIILELIVCQGYRMPQ